METPCYILFSAYCIQLVQQINDDFFYFSTYICVRLRKFKIISKYYLRPNSEDWTPNLCKMGIVNIFNVYELNVLLHVQTLLWLKN